MSIVAAVCLGVWVISAGLLVWGTFYTRWRLRQPEPMTLLRKPPISVLKPVKGLDPGLEENLRSFFHLDYPEFELIFAVASSEDPCLPVIKKVINEYPEIDATLVVGESAFGCNPKVKTLTGASSLAKYDHILISDSNIRARRRYLQEAVPFLEGKVGVVSASVAGFGAQNFCGELEALHLNTYYSRWMHVARSFGVPFVLGKSMFYRQSVLTSLGGLEPLAQYIAEDYMMGVTMERGRHKIDLQYAPIWQFVGRRTLREFWDRHLRWTIIQKKCVPFVFLLEPLHFSLVIGAVGAAAVAWFLPGTLPATVMFWLTLALWYACDVLIAAQASDPCRLRVWAARELLSPLIWLRAATTNRIDWRGHKLRILPLGLVERD